MERRDCTGGPTGAGKCIITLLVFFSVFTVGVENEEPWQRRFLSHKLISSRDKVEFRHPDSKFTIISPWLPLRIRYIHMLNEGLN